MDGLALLLLTPSIQVTSAHEIAVHFGKDPFTYKLVGSLIRGLGLAINHGIASFCIVCTQGAL